MPAFTHHIFICGNQRAEGHPRGSCDPLGKQGLREVFRTELKKAGASASVRANHSGCLDQCEHGPTVVIYPRGIWYGRVRESDVVRIVRESVVGDGVVADLLIADSCLNNTECPHRKPEGGA